VRAGNLRSHPDFVLGDRHGSSCAPALTDAIERALVRRGHDISRNRPYAGGFITEHYGKPKDGTHAIQIEINRALYLDERTLRRTKGYAALEADIAGLIGELVHECYDLVDPPREAAE
jgi:N-formylglutamate amidohydrolase